MCDDKEPHNSEAATYPMLYSCAERMVRLRSKSVTTPFARVPPKAVHGSSTTVGRSLLLREELRSCADAAHLHQNEKR